jgi:hypothetical protein
MIKGLQGMVPTCQLPNFFKTNAKNSRNYSEKISCCLLVLTDIRAKKNLKKMQKLIL